MTARITRGAYHLKFNMIEVLSTWTFFWQCFVWGVICRGRPRVTGRLDMYRARGSRIDIGKNFSCISTPDRASATALFSRARLRTLTPEARILIEKNVGMNNAMITARSKTVYIDEGTMIGPNVIIVDSDFHALFPPEGRINNPGFERDKDVRIGKNVWIGMNSIILKGVTIGDNAVIGAGSVVRSSVGQNTVVAGNPAIFIKDLRN